MRWQHSRSAQASRRAIQTARAIPALKAAANGDVQRDDQKGKFIINGDALEPRGMANLLKDHAPEAYQQATRSDRNRASPGGFGENIAGDKPPFSLRAI